MIADFIQLMMFTFFFMVTWYAGKIFYKMAEAVVDDNKKDTFE